MPKKFLCKVTNACYFKQELYRFVVSSDERACFDPDFQLEGRNFNVLKDSKILDSWLNSRFFKDHLGVEVNVEDIRMQILRHFYNKMLTIVALAKKSGKLHLGRNNVLDFLNRGSAKGTIFIQATDASLKEKFIQNNGLQIIELFSSDELSAILGKETVKYALIQKDFMNNPRSKSRENHKENLIELENIYKFFNEKK